LNFQRGRPGKSETGRQTGDDILKKVYYSPFFLFNITGWSVGINETLCQRIQISSGKDMSSGGFFKNVSLVMLRGKVSFYKN
jgi:hypothetical protein